ncbi:GntR family transcriptional regulator [Clostridium sp. DL1XJH146]
MRIEFNDRSPIYVQIVQCIKKQIISGELKMGEKLMSVREFATEIKVNPNTIQRAYGELEREKMIYTERGKGKYVTTDDDRIQKLKKDMANSLVNDFIDQMLQMAFNKEEIANMISEKISQ